MYKDERQIARKAEEMLNSALHAKTAGFKSHVKGDDELSLKDALAKAKVKKYGKVKDGNAKFYMRRLSIKMEKHGFVQHYGVNRLRESGKRTRKKPRITEYSFKTHAMNMKATPFLSQAIENSGVIPFVLREITKFRSEEIMLGIKRFMEEKI